ncbi:hypothetical protein DPMN_047587 [Dreissena polymorpha]|uniref:Uncharacterized protein n=1 Tax=Dreissena polymorpha TaxID=45954 RepID=A0A9D4I206_DREPO|nr:hypothetical protein DPMN_047587 [Dreissena polymorpha]
MCQFFGYSISCTCSEYAMMYMCYHHCLVTAAHSAVSLPMPNKDNCGLQQTAMLQASYMPTPGHVYISRDGVRIFTVCDLRLSGKLCC